MLTRVRIFIHVSKQISTCILYNLIQRYKAVWVLSENVFQKISLEHVCGVTKLLQTTIYPTVIMVLKGTMERKKKLLKEEFVPTLGPIWHKNKQHVCFPITNLL